MTSLTDQTPHATGVSHAISGKASIACRTVSCPYLWTSVDNYIGSTQAILTGFNTMLAKYPAEQQADVWRAIAEVAGQSTTPDERCRRTENEVVLAVGRR